MWKECLQAPCTFCKPASTSAPSLLVGHTPGVLDIEDNSERMLGLLVPTCKCGVVLHAAWAPHLAETQADVS